MPEYEFYEFFAGGGMARAGLGGSWRCLFANDFDLKKSRTYELNWGKGTLKTCDLREITASDLPGQAHLAWASFPCQDLSLAGSGAGLAGKRSGTFWPFWNLVEGLAGGGRSPRIIVLENVCGTLTSHGGDDFRAICEAMRLAGYRVGAVIIDAVRFVPQSRPRLFIVCVRDGTVVPPHLMSRVPVPTWHTRALITAHDGLSSADKANWIWYNMETPSERRVSLEDIVEQSPGTDWHSQAETKKLLAMMSPINAEKVLIARKAGRAVIGTIYKRTRKNKAGVKVQRAEIRFDSIAGCLRTPAGGSSRQVIMLVNGEETHSRLISARETARLMGLPDTYQLPEAYNEAYHLTGDGLVVPVVRYLAAELLEPIVAQQAAETSRTAA